MEKPLAFAASGRRFLGYLRPHRWRVMLVVSFAVISVALVVTGPRVLGRATDIVFDGVVGKLVGGRFPRGTTIEEAASAIREHGNSKLADMVASMHGVIPGQGIDFTALRTVLLVVAAVYLGAFVFGWLQSRIIAYVVQQTIYDLRSQVEDKLDRLPLRYFDSQQPGEVLSRVTNDIDNVSQTLTQTLAQLLRAVLTVAGVLVMMFWISWILALVALVTIPLSIVVTLRVARRSQPQFVKQWSSTGRLNAHVEEMYTGHELVKVFGHQKQAITDFVSENDELYEASFRSQFVSGTIQPLMGFIANLGYVVVAVVGGLQVAGGTLSLGSVQAFIQYSRQFSQPVTQIASMMNLLQSGVASAERVFGLLDAEEETADPVDPVVLERARDHADRGLTTSSTSSSMSRAAAVAFDDVSFRYLPDKPLIEHLTLAADPGHTVAIVGPTGAGKTTLVNLLMRFYEVDAGRIMLDGVDTRLLTRAALRSSVGMVLQDTWLFQDTIMENIRYGRLAASDEEVIAAATTTYVDHFVRSLPDGYETVLDDGAQNLSSGEKQLVTIARAFLADPAILVLDEATSSVDTRTEVLVQDAMNALRRGRTSFVIAHRLSTIRDADTIVVMENGAIVEQGNHADLIEREGAYWQLYQSQFARPADA